MNALCKMSYVVVIGILFVGSISASEYYQSGMGVPGKYPFTTLANLALHKSRLTTFERAACSTIARRLDSKSDKNPRTFKEDAVNLALYMLIEEGEKKIEENYKVRKKVDHVCDSLPESFYIRDAVKAVVNLAADVVANPQMIIYVLAQITPDSIQKHLK
jgi:hypothetical protein